MKSSAAVVCCIALILFFTPCFEGRASELTVLSYNIRYDNPLDGPDNWQYRCEELAAEVLSYKPQIIGLQEALKSQVDFLASRWTNYAWYGVGREDGAEKGEFVPVFYDTTRYHMLRAQTMWLSPYPSKPGKGWDATCERVVAIVQFLDKQTGERLVVLNTHWDHEGTQARAQSALMIADLLRSFEGSDMKAILLGDLNATPDEQPLSVINEVMVDACPKKLRRKPTFNAFELKPADNRHIDYVFVSKNITKVIACRIPQPRTKAGRQMSDHYPVLVTLKL